MRQHLALCGALALATIACTSLGRGVYLPPVTAAPLFTSAGELSVAAGYGPAGAEAQAAYAVTDFLAVTLEGQALGRVRVPPWHAARHYDDALRYLGGSLGYFGKFAHSGVFEVFAGVGYGEVSAVDFFDSLHVGRYVRGVLQLDAGGLAHYFEYGGYTRLSYMAFTYVRPVAYTAYFDEGPRFAPGLFFELGGFFRAGFEYLKLEAQFVAYRALPVLDPPWAVPFTASLGLRAEWDFAPGW